MERPDMVCLSNFIKKLNMYVHITEFIDCKKTKLVTLRLFPPHSHLSRMQNHKKKVKKKNLDYDLPFWFWLFSLYFVHAGKSRPQLLFRCLWAELVHHWARLEGSVLQVWPSCRCEHCVWPAVKTLPGLCVCLLRKSRWCQRGEQKRMFIFYFF